MKGALQKISVLFKEHGAMASLVCSVIGFLSGAVVQDLRDTRSAKRDAIKAEVAQALQAETDLSVDLRKFSEKALGRGLTNEEDLQRLRTNVWKLNSFALRLTAHLPSVQSPYERYAAQLVNLQKSAEKLKGLIDGAPFVEAVSNFLDAQQTFNSQVATTTNSYF